MASPVNNPAWLEWIATLMGGVSRQTTAAAFPSDRFYCLLDELPLHLVPRHVANARAQNKRELYLNPDCELVSDKNVPPELADQTDLLSGFALQGTIAWVRDCSRQSLLPFWLGPAYENVVRALRSGDRAPTSLPESIQSVLAAAGILKPKDGNNERKRTHDEAIRKARAQFEERGYAPLAGLIHPYHVAALRRYYRCLIRKGVIKLGDEQSPLRSAVHNEPVARFFHHQIAATMSIVADQPLHSSYVYLASYLSGAELKKHTDREQCEFSLTLCLDYAPEPNCATPWPIRLDTTQGTAIVYQALGDGLAYRGTRLPHYREKLGTGQTSTSIFFHYVSADFNGSLM